MSAVPRGISGRDRTPLPCPALSNGPPNGGALRQPCGAAAARRQPACSVTGEEPLGSHQLCIDRDDMAQHAIQFDSQRDSEHLVTVATGDVK
eukprot:SAG11_NODE_12_length_27025_cov_37.402681_19_plen_92_part_00